MSINFLTARWSNLIMANYAVPPALLAPYLPAGTSLDFFEGKTYVSLVGFMFLRTRVFGIPVPGLGNFEEINLRFYVTHQTDKEKRRGVVFINETVPFRLVAWLANKLYKEHYVAIPTRHSWHLTETAKQIEYRWKIAGKWNQLQVSADNESREITTGSIEEFILEHYWGYSALQDGHTIEYQVSHDRWKINPVKSFVIDCNFFSMYGQAFAFLNQQQPDSVLLAEGSPVAVKWKKTKILKDAVLK